MKVVIALGGNAIQLPGSKGDAFSQLKACNQTAESLFKVLSDPGVKVALTHGNGPQVGMELLRHDIAKDKLPPFPMDFLGAMTQGYIGYMLSQSIRDVFAKHGIIRGVATVVTQVIVDPSDPAFENPTKPVGPFYTKEEAEELMASKGWVIKEDAGRGYRRVVPSPEPLDIVELDEIKDIYEDGKIPISVGGGGIPVIKTDEGLRGVEAVIDKDLASALLANKLGAEKLIILTQVDRVYINFGKPEQRGLDRVSLEEIKRYYEEGHFPAGSMGPKIKAAIKFLERGGDEVVIASLEDAADAVLGKAGTTIYK